MKDPYFIALQRASSTYCSTAFPDNWDELNAEAQYSWLDENKSADYELMSNDDFYSLIDTLSHTIKEAVRESLNELHRRLVDIAVADALPSDFNELDLELIMFRSK